jgi:hypothetical protein
MVIKPLPRADWGSAKSVGSTPPMNPSKNSTSMPCESQPAPVQVLCADSTVVTVFARAAAVIEARKQQSPLRAQVRR